MRSIQYFVPEISNNRIRRLLKRMVPVKHFDGFEYAIVKAHPRTHSYTWGDADPDNGTIELVPICVVETYHTCGYVGLFKPSIAEVLAQCPPRIANDCRIVAFTTKPAPHDNWREVSNADGDCHRGVTTFFGRLMA